MENQNKVMGYEVKDDRIHFFLDPDAKWPLGNPAGKMLTDTDRDSFVYAFDHEDSYRYVHFPKESWGGLVEMLLRGIEPVLCWEDQGASLENAKEELQALIYNIEGNDNYGEAFSRSVEEIFRPVLEQV